MSCNMSKRKTHKDLYFLRMATTTRQSKLNVKNQDTWVFLLEFDDQAKAPFIPQRETCCYFQKGPSVEKQIIL